jgi:hypothetical protein
MIKQPYPNTTIESNPFTKIGCPLGGKPSAVIYTVEAGKYSSYVSQADADAQAQAEITANGQSNANNKGTCTFTNTAKSDSFTIICAAGGSGGTFLYTVNAGKYTSILSQADADAKAQDDIATNGTKLANAKGNCTFANTAKSASFTRNNCTAGSTGGALVYTVAAGKYTSTLSQADADAQAQADIATNGPKRANALCSCVFYSKALTNVGFRKNNCRAPKVGSIVYYSVAAGKFSSTVSQAAADAQAQKAGQANANTKGTCR